MERDNLKPKRENEQPAQDRLDWISKYLELADRVMQNHAPERSKESS